MKKKVDQEALAYILARTAVCTAFCSDHVDELDEDDEERGRVNWAFLPLEEDMERARKACRFDYLSDEEEEEEALADTPEYREHLNASEDEDEEEEPPFDENGRAYGIVCGWTVEDELSDDDDEFFDGTARLCVRFGYVDRETPREDYRDYEAWKDPFADPEAEEEDDEEPGEDFDWKEYLFDAAGDDTPRTEFPVYGRNSLNGHKTFASEWVDFLRIAELVTGLYERAAQE